MGEQISTARPAAVDAGRHTKDDGLFGPDSVTWRVHCELPMGIIGAASATTQMLHPRVMHMIDQASSFRTHPELRAQRTGEYIMAITYGDTETAENAAALLNRIHKACEAVDPVTGERYGVLDQEYLLWVHHVLVWMSLRGFDTYGPVLSATDRDRYVDEQRIAARLVGCDLDQVVSTAADLDAWVAAQLPKLALTHATVWFRDMVVPSGIPLGAGATVDHLMARAAVGIMAPEHRDLYGLVWPAWSDALTRVAVDGIFKGIRSKLPVEGLVPSIRADLDVKAFGSRNATR
jgi:uncharacterized protein (DUF2236 family)